MLPSIIDPAAPLPDPATLPRGLVTPPQEVREFIAREKARLAPNYGPEYEILALNDLTLAYYFEHQLVAFRETPEGPEVLAVGDEVFDFLDRMPPEQRQDVHLKQV